MNDWTNTLGFNDYPNEKGNARDGHEDRLYSEEVAAGVNHEPEGNTMERVVGLTFCGGETIWQAKR